MTAPAPDAVTIDLVYLGPLRHKIGCKEERLTLTAPVTVRTVLDELVAVHGAHLADLFFNQYGWLDPRLMVLIDGETAAARGGLEAPLSGTERVEMVLGVSMSGG